MAAQREGEVADREVAAQRGGEVADREVAAQQEGEVAVDDAQSKTKKAPTLHDEDRSHDGDAEDAQSKSKRPQTKQVASDGGVVDHQDDE